MGGIREASRLRTELSSIKAQYKANGCGSVERGGDAFDSLNAEMVDDDIYHWSGYIGGGKGTDYEGGRFELDIRIPERYPYSPPNIFFVTPIWHPNISSQTGAICLDILKLAWTPAITIRTALLSIQALLSTPEPADPQDAQVAKMYVNNINEFRKTAVQWTKQYAKPGIDPLADKISALTEMGFHPSVARRALVDARRDQDQALNILLK